MKYDFYYYKNFFTPNECNEISNAMKALKSNVDDDPAEHVEKIATVNVIRWGDAQPLLWRMEDIAHHVNEHVFGFAINKFTTEHYINHNVYSDTVKGKYDWHKDSVMNELYDLKLTVIANISPNRYEGGEFEFFINGPKEVPEVNEQGSILIFPSYTFHRVNPVTKGERETVSLWINGPNFR